MVSGSRADGGAQVLSAGVRRTIQSIKEIVGNHSDADIYVALKETNMDPNETTQKLLNQDPFHEVKRRRDRRKEIAPYKSFATPEPLKIPEPARMQVKNSTYSDRNARRSGYSRTTVTGASQEFRVVRDNRVNQNSSADSKPAQGASEVVISSGSTMSSTETSGHQDPSVGQHSSRALNNPAVTKPDQAKVGKEILGEKHLPKTSATSRVETKANGSQPYSAGSSSSSVVGVYSSNSDPVHVPSPHSRPAANIGAIRREVGVVGPRRQSSDNSAKSSASQSNRLPNKQSGRDGQSRESTRSFNDISKSEQANQNIAPVSAVPVSKSFASNHQYGSSRPHQPTGHQKASQPNKEWKPKATAKLGASGPGVIGSPVKTVSPPSDKPDILRKEEPQIEDSVSRLNVSENQNVIIAAHIRVSETDRCRLTFGSLGTDLGTSANSMNVGAEALSINPAGSVPISSPESSRDEQVGGSKPLETMDDYVRGSVSDSPASAGTSDHQPTENEGSSMPQDMGNYADSGLVRDNSPSYSPETLQQQDTSELPSFSDYDPQVGYDMAYFPPIADETVGGTALPSSQEVPSTHTSNVIPVSSIAMVQQQQQLAQMYPQLQFTNLMPYRQFVSPIYVPPMPVQGYSNSPAYPHPSNGNGYVLMPGNSAHHLTASGVKYGVQPFKPVPAGGPTAFGSFTSPSGYTINTGNDELSRIKYKDNLYVPNPQAETSEIWMNPRELQSASYYNMPGQTPHPTGYLTSHSGHHHASFTAPQSSHVQFPGMYHHPPPQPGPIAGPHHGGPNMGGSVGVGVAAPSSGPQMGAYQQTQLGHLNWTGNF